MAVGFPHRIWRHGGRGYRPGGIWRPGSASEIDGAQPPLEFERISGGRSNLTYGVTDSAGRRWALRRPPLGKRLASAHDMGREHRIIAALAGTDVPVPPAVGAVRGRVGERRTLLRHGLRRGPDPAHQGRGGGELRRGGPAGHRRARRRHAGRDPRGRPRRGRRRGPGPQGGLRRPPAPPLARPVGEVEDARARADRRRPPPTRPSASPSRARRRSSTATTASTT